MKNNDSSRIIEEGKIKIPKKKKINKKDEIEGLTIYGKYLDLISYTEMILKKYPKSERFALATFTKNKTYEGMESIIYAFKCYDRAQKFNYLNEIDIKLKMIKVLIRVAFKNKYITVQNYRAWSNKLFHVGNLLGAWINSCLKQ